MKFVDDWVLILKRAWSIKFIILSGVFTGAEVALPLFADAMPRHIFAVLSIFCALAAIWARITVQRGMHHGDK